MNTELHAVRIGNRQVVLRFTDRRPDDAPLLEWPSDDDVTFTKQEAEDINRWLHLTFDKYRPYVCRFPDGKEGMATKTGKPPDWFPPKRR